MIDPRWNELYARITRSTEATPVAGYYNLNYVEVVNGSHVVLRVPIANADAMDLRLLPEHVVLQRARDAGLRVPRILGVSTDPPFQVHEFVPGVRLDELAPRGTSMPQALLTDVANFFDILWRAPHDELSMPSHWPASGDTSGLFDRLVGHVQDVYDATRGEYGALFHAIGVPPEPLTEVRARKSTLSPRQFALIHCDVHRKNCVVNEQTLWYLDWELALIGDPVYDLAVHLHKMTYPPDDEESLLMALAARSDTSLGDGWEPDLAIYRWFERLKSVLVDTVRYSQQVRDPRTLPTLRHTLIDKWRGKLLATQQFWGNRVPDESEAEALLTERGVGGRGPHNDPVIV